MKTQEWKNVDKSDWPRGEWDNEPDKMQWPDPTTGYPCLIVRNRFGGLCGYVGVTEGHSAFNKNHNDVDVEVHGGLTFSEFCQPEHNGICHTPDPGEPDRVFWLGFDCGHGFDLMPLMLKLYEDHELIDGEVYRNIAYVKAEVANLAAQLKELA